MINDDRRGQERNKKEFFLLERLVERRVVRLKSPGVSIGG